MKWKCAGEQGWKSESNAALNEGTIILGGRYRIERLLYQRPRLNLYLGRRIIQPEAWGEIVNVEGGYEPLVAIRELVLSDLGLQVRAQIEAAAWEEFVSPVVLGSPRLPVRGDRLLSEGERNYLIMQLHNAKNERQATALPLSDLLSQQQWPLWLNGGLVHHWGAQLCCIVARLHRLGVVLGDLDPSTILVDSAGKASWAPVLLVSWPPAPQFWKQPPRGLSAKELYRYVFPIAKGSLYNAFIAPEVLHGECDERSDVYSLGAILYLLLTRFAPTAAARRLRTKQQEETWGTRGEAWLLNEIVPLEVSESLELIPPRLLNDQIPVTLEHVVLKSLALHPADRYPSAFALVEALEAAEQEDDNLTKAHYKRWLTEMIEKLIDRISGLCDAPFAR